MQAHTWLWISLLAPLMGGILSFIQRSHSKSCFWGSVGMIISLIASFFLINQTSGEPISFTFQWWPGMTLSWRIDQLSALLMFLVSLISLLVHLFSLGYMRHDPSYRRYFGFLGLFSFSMLALLASDHLLLLFVFWEMVGFSSYLLIGFWWQKEENALAARMAFITNRVADVCLLAGLLWWAALEQSLHISELSIATIPEAPAIGFLLVMGAFGKSAQLPFYPWLSRAMAGPTPVSALIHAATMVAAGVYLLARVQLIFVESVMLFIVIFGALTALSGALAALVQLDIKKVLAYSTISQLGYMVLGVGVGAYGASLFHLWTHAFFKAGLFLAAGAVIHFLETKNVSNPQDMRVMGGLRKDLPVTFWSYLLCMLSLSGLPLFTGFLSKDGIIVEAGLWALQYLESYGVWVIMIPLLSLITALLTAFYMGRQLMMVFFGKHRFDKGFSPTSESWITHYIPLGILGFGSLGFIYSLNPFSHEISFLEILTMGAVSMNTKKVAFVLTGTPFVSFLLSVGGLALAYRLYRPQSSFYQKLSAYRPRTILLEAFYLDSFYLQLAKFSTRLSQSVAYLDRKIIDPFIDLFSIGFVVFSKLMELMDKLMVDGVVKFLGNLAGLMGRFFSMFQAARVQLHVFWMVVGILLLLIGFHLI
jgi:NADH-quinone oxidoreductase subunit L